jgi:hypothetical protein
MNLNKPINFYNLRLLIGQIKKHLGIIQVRGWQDEPFWSAWIQQKNRITLNNDMGLSFFQRIPFPIYPRTPTPVRRHGINSPGNSHGPEIDVST